MRALEAIRRANRPGPPEHSIRLRAACLLTVVAAIAACASMGELSGTTAFGAIGLVALGMAFSYRTRHRPPGWVKIVVAGGAIAASAWFVHAVSSPASNITSVEDPLTVLLVSVLVVHSFHVPSRRDLMFSLAASAGLMAVAGAQAIELTFGFYVVAWAGLSIWGMIEMWASASGGGRLAAPRLGMALAAVIAAAAAVFLVLPAPTVAAKLNLLSRAGDGGSIGLAGALAGDGGSPSQLSRPGTPSGATRVGGYLGFASSLNTALRGKLGNTVVMLVRTQRPSYWVGETFNTWSGESWTATGSATHVLREQSPFILPPPDGSSPLGQADLQTFYVVNSTANLVFHAQSASQLWFPTSKVYYSEDGTIVSPIGLGEGAVYSVESQVTTPTPGQLRAARGEGQLAAAVEQSSLQLPHAYPRVEALAKSITAGDTTNYDRVESLIAWIGAHTHYSTDIPPLPPGADTVDEFLFGNRVGFCEQISTSLAVMLRSIGIPTREVVGYVPGPYNPITDLYEVRANDAHAWVQVWFPGFGWQNFDPTAVVPLANPAPGAAALDDIGHALARIPVLPVAITLLGLALAAALVRRRRTRPLTWAERIALSAERVGRRAGRPRRPHETFGEYAATLDALTGSGSEAWRQLAVPVEASVYGGHEPSPEAQRQMVSRARRLRVVVHRSRDRDRDQDRDRDRSLHPVA
jgi:transglutaminase-like putative cysteine protease